jgi:Tol biopolymer transport system component
MNADGTRQRQLTNMRDGTCQPAWSPDGSQLAFISPCPGRRDTYEGSSIFLMNADGTNQHLLPVTPSLTGDYDPAWSPDGKKIVFTSLRNGRSQIFVYDLTNSLLTILSNSIFPDKQPVWQPSGLQIAFVREAPNGQVWIMDSDGKHPVQFSPSGGINNLWPTWSRDGQYILYNQTSVDVFTPWLIGLRYQDRNSGREFHIPANPDREIGPVAKVDISPDGMWIAYESWIQASNHDIYIMSINGANQIRMTTDPGFDFGPVWRPIVTPP